MVRIGTIAENALEWIVVKSGLAPTPLMDTMGALMLARTIMAATQVGIFEALAGGPLTPQQVAERCRLDHYATEKLLLALYGARYLRAYGATYGLAPVARRWLLQRNRHSLRDAVLHRYLDLDLMGHYEAFLRTGRPTNFHDTLSEEQWEVYQRGQRAHAILGAVEVALRTPVPRGARAMLDIGGGHGGYAVALCRRHKGLQATILDLPAAVAQAAPLLAEEKMGDRVILRPGNALTDDLGEDLYDLILVANLAHHLDDAANRDLIFRSARALRRGGYCAIVELIRVTSGRGVDQVAALTGFYFAATSESGTWSFAEMAGWQRAAGLAPRRPITLLSAPGLGMQVAQK